ncbi:hypothetical protein CR513_10257, partial [Mucuna pruriens]
MRLEHYDGKGIKREGEIPISRSLIFYFEVIKNNLHPQSFTYTLCHGSEFYFFTRSSNHILLLAPPITDIEVKENKGNSYDDTNLDEPRFMSPTKSSWNQGRNSQEHLRRQHGGKNKQKKKNKNVGKEERRTFRPSGPPLTLHAHYATKAYTILDELYLVNDDFKETDELFANLANEGFFIDEGQARMTIIRDGP